MTLYSFGLIHPSISVKSGEPSSLAPHNSILHWDDLQHDLFHHVMPLTSHDASGIGLGVM